MVATNSSEEYIFWVFNSYDDFPGLENFYKTPRALTKTIITPQKILFEDKAPLIIELTEISEIVLTATRTYLYGVRIHINNSSEKSARLSKSSRAHIRGSDSQIIIPCFPVDPLDPRYSSLTEAKAFIEIVEKFKLNEGANISSNPYLRQFQKQIKNPLPDEVWDSNISPLIYFQKYYVPWGWRGWLCFLLCICTATFIGFLVLGLVLALFFGGITINGYQIKF